MDKRILTVIIIVFFVLCVGAGYFLPSSVALPLAVGVFIVSTVIASAQKQRRQKLDKETPRQN